MQNERHIMDYFLGALTTEEAERLETDCFADEDFAAQVFAVEDELVDRYVRDELNADERARFEKFYLTTDARRERVRFARALKENFANAQDSSGKITAPLDSQGVNKARVPFWRGGLFSKPLAAYALALILLIFVAAALWLLFARRHETPSQIAKTTNEPNITNLLTPTPTPTLTPTASQATPSPQSSPAPKPSLHKPNAANLSPSNSLTAVFTLRPGALRDTGEGEQIVKLAPQIGTVILQFVLPDDEDQTYAVEIQTAEGDAVFTQRGLKATNARGQRMIVLRAPASRFSARDYVARVLDANQQTAASYVFRVKK